MASFLSAPVQADGTTITNTGGTLSIGAAVVQPAYSAATGSVALSTLYQTIATLTAGAGKRLVDVTWGLDIPAGGNTQFVQLTVTDSADVDHSCELEDFNGLSRFIGDSFGGVGNNSGTTVHETALITDWVTSRGVKAIKLEAKSGSGTPTAVAYIQGREVYA